MSVAPTILSQDEFVSSAIRLIGAQWAAHEMMTTGRDHPIEHAMREGLAQWKNLYNSYKRLPECRDWTERHAAQYTIVGMIRNEPWASMWQQEVSHLPHLQVELDRFVQQFVSPTPGQ